MIELTRLILRNFLSHVDTSIDLCSDGGLILIEGITSDGHYSSNGAGKSTILEGIVYALTGDTLRGIAVNDVVNRNYKKNTEVSLFFKKDGTEYTVSRYRKDDKFGDSLILKKFGEDISKRVNKDTQKLLEDTLGVSYKVLASTVLLGEGLSSRFTQLSDPEKKSLIESTLNLNYDINKIRESANDSLKSLKLECATLDGKIAVLEDLNSLDLDSLQASILDNKECIRIYTETINSISSESEALTSEIDTINPKLKLISEAISKHDSLDKKLSELIALKNRYEVEYNSLLSAESPTCLLCHQPLQSEESKTSVLNKYELDIKNTLTEILSLEKEISDLPAMDMLQTKYNSLSQEFSSKSERYRMMLSEENSYRVKIAEVKKDIEISLQTIKKVENENEALSEQRIQRDSVSKDLARYEYFYKLFSPTGIIVDILAEAIQYINTRLSSYSEVLLEKDYQINFNKGKISLIDKNNSSYQSLSNGEKRRLDIAIQFSLHDYVHMYCGMKMNCCFIDEILDTLDDIGVENIFDVLRMKLDYCNLSSIYVITHNNSLKSKFDKFITIRKNSNGDSYIV